MAAYAFFDNVDVLDHAALQEYKERVRSVVERFGGRYVVLGGDVERVEGDWQPVFPVMIEFPDLDTARRWYGSPEYAELKALRHSAVRSRGVLIAGL